MIETKTPWELNDIDKSLINIAFKEDLGLTHTDITTALLFPDLQALGQAYIVSKHPEPSILCGLALVKTILAQLNAKCEVSSAYQDGDVIQPGETLLTIKGPAPVLLMAERTLLNFLQHLCAIATLTAKFVQKVSHTKTKILDTRKTLPGFRHLEKYAVQCGGGVNHRMGLYDALMIKDTHIDLIGGIDLAISALPKNIIKKFPVIVEVRNLQELTAVLEQYEGKISRVLLDNMSLTLLEECVNLCNGKIPTEASGNVSLENIVSIAQTGVDFISIGKLTHSAGNIDLSMKCHIQHAK